MSNNKFTDEEAEAIMAENDLTLPALLEQIDRAAYVDEIVLSVFGEQVNSKIEEIWQLAATSFVVARYANSSELYPTAVDIAEDCAVWVKESLLDALESFCDFKIENAPKAGDDDGDDDES